MFTLVHGQRSFFFLKTSGHVLQLALLEADMAHRAHMLELVLSQPLFAPSDSILYVVGIEDVDHDCLCLTAPPTDPMADVIVRQERSTLEEVVIWTQSCKNAIQ